jgi:4a-hydroxytetrahydrobiopterin dehydratase
MKAQTTKEIKDFISKNLPKWSYDGGFLTREFKFRDFTEAFAFMTSVALSAEKMDHHPDWSNVFNIVNIKLRTHSSAGVTGLDLELASKAERLSEKYV